MHFRTVGLLIGLLFAWGHSAAQSPVAVMLRLGEFAQIAAAQQSLIGYEMVLYLQYAAAPANSTTVQVRTPTGRTIPLVRQSSTTFVGSALYSTLSGLNAAYPEGSYTFEPSAGTSVPVTLTYAGSLTSVLITNFDALQSVTSSTPTIEWAPIPGAAVGDIITLEIDGAAGERLYYSSDLAPTATQAVISPALPRTGHLSGALSYTKLASALVNGGTAASTVGSGFIVVFPLAGIATAPTLTRQPAAVAVQAGSVLVLDVQASGSAPMAYQWLKDGVAIAGASGSTYTVTSARAIDAGSYTVRVTNAGGAATSTAAAVVVGPALSVTTYAGQARELGTTDGSLAVARFMGLGGIVRDPAGNLYVTDTPSCTVRKIANTGSVSTLAGQPGRVGSRDGVGANALFAGPQGIAIDPAGDVFVADTPNATIRRIAPDGTVTTIAGKAQETGVADGPAATARFNAPAALVFDSSGNLYVADAGNSTIRKLSPQGVVSTFAGAAGQRGATDGPAATARFFTPCGLAIGPDNSLFVIDADVAAVRKITVAGVVSTIAGWNGAARVATDQVGVNATLVHATTIAVDASGTVFVLDQGLLRRILPNGVVQTLPSFAATGGSERILTFSPQSALMVDPLAGVFIAEHDDAVVYQGRVVPGSASAALKITCPNETHLLAPGSSFVLRASVDGFVGYRSWTKDGIAIAGATGDTLVIPSVSAADAGVYALVAGNPAGAVAGQSVTMSIAAGAVPTRITNLSVRSVAGTGAQTLTVGFATAGDAAAMQPLLLRAVGPGLAGFGIGNVLTDPVVTVYQGLRSVAGNDNWSESLAPTFERVGAFGLTTGSNDAAMVVPLSPQVYSMQVTGKQSVGVAMAEVYDVSTPPGSGPRLMNVSARTAVGTGGDILIAGFVLAGETSKTVLVRAVGPGLAPFGIGANEYLVDPTVQLVSNGAVIAANDDWSGDPALVRAFAAVGAFGLANTGSKDAALLVTLKPGLYSAQVRGANDATGVALVEVYEVP